MDKPFLSIDDQISLLAHRGVEPTPSQPTALMRDGYYSIVNGYKDAFIDVEASAVADDDRFMVGTSFDDIYNLFKFDRSLRASRSNPSLKPRPLLELQWPIRSLPPIGSMIPIFYRSAIALGKSIHVITGADLRMLTN